LVLPYRIAYNDYYTSLSYKQFAAKQV